MMLNWAKRRYIVVKCMYTYTIHVAQQFFHLESQIKFKSLRVGTDWSMARAAALALCMGFALCQSALGIADFAHRDPYEIEVQWVLQGREFQFTGFFIEFLGISSALHRKLPQMRLTQSSFSYHYNESALHDQKFFDKLFEKESRNLQILYGKRYNGTAQLQAPVSEIGEFQISASCLAAAEGVLDPDTTAMTDMWRPEVEASSVAACCQACSSTPLCIGWSMTSFSDLDRLHCLLKGSLLKQASDHDLAAMRESPRTDHASGSNMLSARNSKGNSQKPRC